MTRTETAFGCVTFTIESKASSGKTLNQLALFKEMPVLEFIRNAGGGVTKTAIDLGDLRAIHSNGFYFPVKIDFKRKGCGIENRSAVGAIAQVALDFASHFGGQPAFQVFANKADRSFARYGHSVPPSRETTS
jgi:hypothetical protein